MIEYIICRTSKNYESLDDLLSLKTRLNGIQQVIDSVRMSKEKIFKEMTQNLNGLIASKFTLFSKIENLASSLPKMVEELNVKQDLLHSEFASVRVSYRESICNKEKETEAFSRELKRMQDVNRELITEFGHSRVNKSTE